MKNYNWATLGCGVIANQLAQAMKMEGRTLYGIANRTDPSIFRNPLTYLQLVSTYLYSNKQL